MKLRIHHIFDIIRDIGSENPFEQHTYGHSYHLIAQKLFQGYTKPIKLVIGCDDVCTGCKKLQNGKCLDTITHRADFTQKEAFNNYLDLRILDILGMQENDTVTLQEIVDKSCEYINNIEFIYKGNDTAHTLIRKEHVEKGLLILKEKYI